MAPMSSDGHRQVRAERTPPMAGRQRLQRGPARALTARAGSVERTLLWVRLAVVAGIGVLVALGTPWVNSYRFLGAVMVIVAAAYALSMTWARPFLALELSSGLDLALTLLGVAATGGARSPVCGVLLLVVASAALRFDRRRTFLLAATAAVGVLVIGLLVPVPGMPFAARAELSCSWAALTLLMASVVGRLAALEASQQLATWAALTKVEATARSERERRLLLRSLLHDVNTPLAGARVLSRTLPSRSASGEISPVGEATRLLRTDLDYLQLLFDDMRAVVNAYDPGHEAMVVRKACDLPALVEEATRLGEVVTKGTTHEVTVDVATGTPTVVHTDGPKLQRIVTNLVANAVEHAGLHGPVDVTLTSGNGMVTIGVADRGEQIPDTFLGEDLALPGPGHDQERLRGVGLWVVRQLTMVLDGELHIDNRQGGGNLITVTLPAPAVDPAPERGQGLPTPHGSTR